MLEVKKVTKKFGENVAVNTLSFRVGKGKIYGLVGRNGAGKSTTFRMILNIIKPTSGEILYNREKITQEVLDRFGYLPEEGSLIPSYTVLELCEYYGALKLMDSSEIREKLIAWLEKFNILEYLNKKIKDLSKGNRQKIQFIVSNLHNPEFLILDEPFSGLDPISVEELKKCILELKKEGKTIIFSSHRMDHVEELCDDIVILDKGQTVLKGNLEKIKATYEINGKVDNSLNDIFIDAVENVEAKEDQDE
jgi:ABC-2 type transport system ATP-binding protein